MKILSHDSSGSSRPSQTTSRFNDGSWTIGRVLPKSFFSILHNEGFKIIATMKRPKYFDIWAIASKLPASKDRMQMLVNATFPKNRGKVDLEIGLKAQLKI